MADNNFVRDIYNLDPSTSFVEDADGNLVGRPSVTCIGVFPYLMEDGSVFNELRLPEEVFSNATLDSMRLLPVTLEHPNEMVTPDNIAQYQVGVTGEDVCRAENFGGDGYLYKTDGTQVTIPMKITNRLAIDAVKRGKRGLSCGYHRDLEMTSGTWCGMHYDGIQRNIRVNHIAIVDRGRAGDTAVIRMDNAFVPTFMEKVVDKAPAEENVVDSAEKGLDNKEANMPKKELVLDSTPYEVEEAVADAYDAVVAERDTIKGQLDMANSQIEALKAEMSGMIKADVLPQKVREYQAIKETADKFGVSLEDGMSVLDMKRAIVKVANPALSDSIDEQSEEYVNGAFSFCTKVVTAPKKDEEDHEKQDEDVDKADDDANKTAKDAYDALQKRLSEKYGR